MNPNTSVSIVVPLFNSSETMADALTSIHDQTFRNYEVILVDDASQDDSYVRACEACSDREKWQVIRQQVNRGPSGARNAGIRAATGNWVAFLDADDSWHPRKLELQMQWIADADVRFCCTGSGDLSKCSVQAFDDWRRRAFDEKPLTRDLNIESFLDNNAVVTSSVLVKRSVFDDVGLFDERFRGPEDLDLWLRIARENQLLLVDVPLINYRHHSGSLSMDERRFIPEIEGVWQKAFSPGGVFADRPELFNTALSTQHVNGAWMAFCRGARGSAVRHLLRAYVLNLRTPRRVSRPWLRLLLRYVAGSPPQSKDQ